MVLEIFLVILNILCIIIAVKASMPKSRTLVIAETQNIGLDGSEANVQSYKRSPLFIMVKKIYKDAVNFSRSYFNSKKIINNIPPRIIHYTNCAKDIIQQPLLNTDNTRILC